MYDDTETMEPTIRVVGEGNETGWSLRFRYHRCDQRCSARIINPKGKFVREGKRVRHDKYGMGSYVMAFEEEAGSVKDVEITEVDIDNFIRAKGAIFSAIRTMLYLSVTFDVSMIEDVYVAGGIGSGINMQMPYHRYVPGYPAGKIPLHRKYNSSLTGAYSMLLSTAAEKKTMRLPRI